ncbi:MAG: DUF4185 domain-containing protein [Proteobacteria bacterium]|nr:DUF4185 domain-containing protein [Pseudomonadota bacterium]
MHSKLCCYLKPNCKGVAIAALLAALVLFLPARAFAEQTNVLFVANGYYQQETDIYNHLQDLGTFDITLERDYSIRSNTDFTPYDLLIITGFAPNISYSGLRNIADAGVPVLIIEYWDFWYSYNLGLLRWDSGDYYGTESVELIESQHPITSIFDETIRVYEPWYVLYGASIQSIEPGITPLVYSWQNADEAAVIVDETRKIVATGIYDTTHYTQEAWMLFDQILNYLHPVDTGMENPSMVNQALVDEGVMSFLTQINDDHTAWTHETAMREIWPMLMRANLTFAKREISDLVYKILDSGWGFEPRYVLIDGVDKLSAIVFYPRIGGSAECIEWFESTVNQSSPSENLIPISVTYDSTQLGGIPVFKISANDEEHLDLLFDRSTNTRFSITLTSYAENFSAGQIYFTAGTSPFINRDDLLNPISYNPVPFPLEWDLDELIWWPERYTDWYTDFEPTSDFVLFWDGWQSHPFTQKISPVTYDPFWSMIHLASLGYTWTRPGFNIILDVYKFPEGVPHQRGKEICSVQIFKDDPYFHSESFIPDAPPLPVDPDNHNKCKNLGTKVARMNCAWRQPPIDYCRYSDPDNPDTQGFNPFEKQETSRAPNAFGDAAHGRNYDNTWDALSDEESLLPQIQMVSPANPSMNKFNLIERFCEDNKESCKDLEGNLAGFKEAVGLDELGTHLDEYYADPLDRIHPRYRHESPADNKHVTWNDRGPWQVPNIKAGFRTQVTLAIRQETSALPENYAAAFCNNELIGEDGTPTDGPTGYVWLAYCQDGGSCAADNVLNPNNEQWTYVGLGGQGSAPGGLEGVPGVPMTCFPLFGEDSNRVGATFQSMSPAIYKDIISNINDGDDSNNEEILGELYELARTINVPPEAGGKGFVVFSGQVKMMPSESSLDNDPRNIMRAFPVYIDPAHSYFGTNIIGTQKPNSWIGTPKAKRVPLFNVVYNSQNPNNAQYTLNQIPSAWDYFDTTATQKYFNYLDTTFIGNDEGPWLRRIKRNSSGTIIDDRLYTLFGDVYSTAANSPYMSYYRGSGLASYIPRKVPGLVDEDFFMGWTDAQGWHPVLLTEGINPANNAQGFAGLPWEIYRRRGFDIENGNFVPGDSDWIGPNGLPIPTMKGVGNCRESGAETIATVSAFQMASQQTTGESYVWLAVGTDWGASSSPGMGGTAGKMSDPLTGFNLDRFIYNYEREYEPYWHSFLTVWNPDTGLDDLGQTASWPCKRYDDQGKCIEATTFLWSTAVAFDHLENFITGEDLPPNSPGIIVWRVGRYRSSPVYLSYAREEDILYPSRYRHFIGFNGDEPRWSDKEHDSVPIIWDDVGEISVIHTRNGSSSDKVFDNFKVIYNINVPAQQGIVMKTASTPWGPYSKTIPIFDCQKAQKDMAAQGKFIQTPDLKWKKTQSNKWDLEFDRGGGYCYGGFTHRALWSTGEMQNGRGWTGMRFNVSMGFAPYKVMMAEALALEDDTSP